ncbi:hypothetical protein HRG_014465 [Hirsutella rhossiliensis]
MTSKEAGGDDYIVRLKESLDWTPWIRGIKSWAQTHEIWEYADPDGIKELEQPQWPDWEQFIVNLGGRPSQREDETEAAFLARRTGYNERYQDAKDSFRNLEKRFQLQFDRYKVQQKALIALEELIKKTISEGLQGTTLIHNSPREKIRELKKQALPSGAEEKKLIYERYTTSVNKRGTRDWKAWAEQLDQIIMDSRDLKVDTLNDVRIRQDFLTAADEWDLHWSTTMRALDLYDERHGKDQLPLRNLIANFKQEYTHRKKSQPPVKRGSANQISGKSDTQAKCAGYKQHVNSSTS